MDELDLARQMADTAAEIALEYFTKDPEVTTKDDGTLVTVADKSIEKELRRMIAGRFPDHAVLGEEEGLIGDPASPVWVLDPIDGTNNFAWGIPIFATLIALRVDGRTEVGIASAPAIYERYEAERGGGAFMNGEPIHVSAISDISDARMMYSSHGGVQSRGNPRGWWPLVYGAQRDRGFGDFWGHMLVARGAGEVMYEPSLAIWDVAALEVIVEEAGGRITGTTGKPYPNSRMFGKEGDGSCISTNGVLHDTVLEALSESGPS
ncbi:MAG TPA: inositol monophosphatase family protein [Actinomycetota bacterium]|nr:inositol monophosphatase family protein [Actinomycetota bacterium]